MASRIESSLLIQTFSAKKLGPGSKQTVAPSLAAFYDRSQDIRRTRCLPQRSSWRQDAGDGDLEATYEILRSDPDAAILVVTMVEDNASVFTAMHASTRGYLMNGADRDETLAAIRAVARGGAAFGPGIARRPTRYFPEEVRPPRLSMPP